MKIMTFTYCKYKYTEDILLCKGEERYSEECWRDEK